MSKCFDQATMWPQSKSARLSCTSAKLHIRKQEECDLALQSIASTLSCDNRRTVLRGKETGQWLSILPSMVNGTMLSAAQEYRDFLLLCYARSPADLQSHCDVYDMPWDARKAVS
jgi:hypothetical protein